MTIRELKKLIRYIPNEMTVVMVLDDESLITVCKEKSSVVTIMDEQDEREETLFLLLPCGCNEEIELGDINSQPELN